MKNQMIALKKQQIKKGIILGALAPIIFSPLVCLILYLNLGNSGGFTFWEFYDTLLIHETELQTFLCLCVLCNLPFFFLFLKKKKDWIAKGIQFGTFAYVVLYAIVKLYYFIS
jgi:hypothetical protein